jgi:predicted dehydrogenase
MVRVGLVGLGYWGPNLVRNFSSLRECQVTAICDRNPKRLEHVAELYPSTFATTDSNELLSSGKVDAVVIGTPTRTHYAIARAALEAGMHTFVEKPLATSSRECAELIRLADERDRVLFVGHVFLYSAAVAKLKKLVVAGELGDLCYISSSRLNLGPIRSDVNALWDLAPHDISIMLH